MSWLFVKMSWFFASHFLFIEQCKNDVTSSWQELVTSFLYCSMNKKCYAKRQELAKS